MDAVSAAVARIKAVNAVLHFFPLISFSLFSLSDDESFFFLPCWFPSFLWEPFDSVSRPLCQLRITSFLVFDDLFCSNCVKSVSWPLCFFQAAPATAAAKPSVPAASYLAVASSATSSTPATGASAASAGTGTALAKPTWTQKQQQVHFLQSQEQQLQSELKAPTKVCAFPAPVSVCFCTCVCRCLSAGALDSDTRTPSSCSTLVSSSRSDGCCANSELVVYRRSRVMSCGYRLFIGFFLLV